MLSKIKKVLTIPKVNFVTGLMIGIIIMATGVYAATLVNSKNVTYNTANSTLSSTNVQDALDELYEKTNNKMIYFFGDTYSAGSSALGYKSYLTSDFMKIVNGLNSNVFTSIDINGEKSACIYLNNKVTCLKVGQDNVKANKTLMNTSFSGATCGMALNGNAYLCQTDSFICKVMINGMVTCIDSDAKLTCDVNVDDTVRCY